MLPRCQKSRSLEGARTGEARMTNKDCAVGGKTVQSVTTTVGTGIGVPLIGFFWRPVD